LTDGVAIEIVGMGEGTPKGAFSTFFNTLKSIDLYERYPAYDNRMKKTVIKNTAI